ncbi:MAG: RluA family pseudouridine synthase [Treponema sp.]|nr:RluA family pseudouridine synthase [Treponema sp.]
MKGITILFEDENLLVLNKPAGLAVQGGKGVGTSLDSLLAMNRKERPLLVHRLDKDTSGVIVTAKNRESASVCSAFFSGLRPGIKKTYLAFCAGILDERGIINDQLIIKGKVLTAQTSYNCRGTMDLTNYVKSQDSSISLAELLPITGRMHQIRRHLAQSGHPILFDDKYGDFALNKKLKKTLGIKRLLLHALSIYLPPSLVQGGMTISAPLPDYFLEMIQKAGMKIPGNST